VQTSSSGFNQVEGKIGGQGSRGGGTGVSGPKPSMDELNAQIRVMASQLGIPKLYSNVTSLLDPMYDIFQKNKTKDPSLAEKAFDWAFKTNKEMQQKAMKGAQKAIDTYADGASKIIDTIAPGGSKILNDLLHNPKDLIV